MLDMRDFKETEQFAIEEEARERVWQEQYGEKLPELVSYMNRLLAEGTNESIACLQELFLEEKGIFPHFKQTDDVAQMYVIMCILEKECEAGVMNHILTHGKTVEDLRLYLESLKFLLYRIDFAVDAESELELVVFIREHGVTVMTLDVLLTSNVMRPMNVALKLEQLFRNNSMYKELFWVLEFINTRWSGNYRILWSMAELFQLIGRSEEAENYLAQIPEAYITGNNKGRDLFLLQEQIWLLKHGEKCAAENVVAQVIESGINIDEWRSILDTEWEMQIMGYFFLMESFEARNMRYYAIVCLETGMIKNDNAEVLACSLADIYVREGKNYEALTVLKKVSEPGEMTCKFIAALERVRK